MTKRFHVLTTWVRDTTSPRDIEVDIDSPSDFVYWWRRNRLDARRPGWKYLFTWTYVSDRSRVYPGSFWIGRSVGSNFPVVYVDFFSCNVREMTCTLPEFERKFFGRVENHRPHFGMCVTIDVK